MLCASLKLALQVCCDVLLKSDIFHKTIKNVFETCSNAQQSILRETTIIERCEVRNRNSLIFKESKIKKTCLARASNQYSSDETTFQSHS